MIQLKSVVVHKSVVLVSYVKDKVTARSVLPAIAQLTSYICGISVISVGSSTVILMMCIPTNEAINSYNLIQNLQYPLTIYVSYKNISTSITTTIR